MRLSHRFKVASKKKGCRVCRGRTGEIRWLKNLRWRIKTKKREQCEFLVRDKLSRLTALSSVYFELPDLTTTSLPAADIPPPPAAPSPPKYERCISMGCVKDVLNVSEPAKKTVTKKMAGFITSLTNRVRGVFNA